jgi:hypothetical protein
MKEGKEIISSSQSHSVGLQASFFKETRSPKLEGWPAFVKDEVISLLPD